MPTIPLNLDSDPFLERLKEVDDAIISLRERVTYLQAGFEGFSYVSQIVEGQLDKLKEALDFGAEMQALSEELGASAGDMAVLSQAAKNVGGGMESARTFVEHFERALSGLNEQGAETQTAFRRLGIDIMAIRHLPLIDQIQMLGRAFQGIGNPADRIKLAHDLLGRSGPEALPMLVNPTALADAVTQVGGLRGVLNDTGESFARLARAFDALALKGEQFYGAFAHGLDGDREALTNFLNKADFTQVGESLGHLVKDLAELMAWLKPLLPVVEFLAANWLLHASAASSLGRALASIPARIDAIISELAVQRGAWEAVAAAATRAEVAQMQATMAARMSMGALPTTERMALPGPGVRIIDAEVIESRFAGLTRAAETFGQVIRNLPSVVGSAMAEMVASIDPLTAAMLGLTVGADAVEAAWEMLLHRRAREKAENEQASLETDYSDQANDFMTRSKSLHSEGDRKALLDSIDEATKEFQKRLSTDQTLNLPKAQMDQIQEAGKNILMGLSAAHDLAAKAPLAPVDANGLASWLVAGRTPVSHLGRIGGGMNMIGAGTDPLLSEARRQTKLLEDHSRHLQNIQTAITGSPTSSRPPVYHST